MITPALEKGLRVIPRMERSSGNRRRRSLVCFSEITTQPLRIGLRVRQGDVAVGPDEVERRALETGSPHPGLPGEAVERKPKFGAGFNHAAGRFAVHVRLPSR